jgi:hypothetical protein
MIGMTKAEWTANGRAKFGDDSRRWKFKCPSCGHVAFVEDWFKAGAPEGAVAFSCVGRWLKADDAKTFQLKGGPCLYSGGGLFRLNPVKVIDEGGTVHELFDFAEA